MFAPFLDSNEWIIQLDGESEKLTNLLKALGKENNMSVGSNHRQHGAAVTRSCALSRSRGNWVVGLDADDYFLTTGLQDIIDYLPKAKTN